MRVAGPRGAPGRIEDGIAGLGLLIAFGWHLARLEALFGGALDGERLVQTDYAFHTAGASAARAAWETSGSLRGWSPELMAGAPTGGITSGSNLLVELLAAVVPAPVPLVVNVTIFLVYLLFPAAWALAGALAGLRRAGVLVAFLLGVAFFWHLAQGGQRFVQWGMYAQVSIFALAPLCAECLIARRWGALSVVTGIGVLLHVLFAPVALLLGVAALLAGPTRWALVSGGAAVSLGLGVVLAPLVGPELVGGAATLLEPGDFFHYAPTQVAGFLREVGIAPWLLLGGGVGLVTLPGRESLQRGIGVGLALGLVLLDPLLGGIQPGRFVLLPLALMPVAALRGLQALPGQTGGVATAALALVVVRATPPAPLAPLLTWERTYPGIHQLVDHLRVGAARGDPEHRLLVEDAVHGVEDRAFGYTHLVALLPRLTGWQVLAAPYSDVRLRHREARLLSGRLAGRPLGELGPLEIRTWLDRYAVSAIVAWSEASLRSLPGVPGVVEETVSGRHHLYRVDDPAPLSPTAKVHAVVGGLEVSEAGTPVTLLRYHWDPRLRTEPPLRMRVSPVAGDPIGFIEVENGGVTRFSVSWGGALGAPRAGDRVRSVSDDRGGPPT